MVFTCAARMWKSGVARQVWFVTDPDELNQILPDTNEFDLAICGTGPMYVRAHKREWIRTFNPPPKP